MRPRVPDEYFRPAAESDDVGSEQAVRRAPETTGVKTVPVGAVREGVTARALAIMLALAIAGSFAIGRIFLFPALPPVPPASPIPTETSAATATPTATPSSRYDGPVQTVADVTATGQCLSGWSSRTPSDLFDDDESSYWSCRGDGIGEAISFTFDGAVPLAGLRVVNGNTVEPDQYLAERRIVAIRWTFSDGSFFEQGLAANSRSPQEVRFPVREADQVVMSIIGSTEPGDGAPSADYVSISMLEFLAAA